MGRGQQNQNLLYGAPQRSTGDLKTRVERRFEDLAAQVGAFDPSSQDPDMEAVSAFERLIHDTRVARAGAPNSLIRYGAWVRDGLEINTPAEPGPETLDQEERAAALARARSLLSRASHRLTDPMVEGLVGSYVAADLACGAGWKSLHAPLAVLMGSTPLKHRNVPVVYRRLMEPWGKSGIRRAPEGKYLVHYSAGPGKVIGQGKALCGTSLTLVGTGGDWNSSSTGKLKVTCQRCRKALSTRPSEVMTITEDVDAQLARLHGAVVSRTRQRVLREITAPGVVPLDADDFVSKVRSHAWDSLITELQSVCERWDHPLSKRTMQVLHRVPYEPELLDGLREGTIPKIVF